MSRSDPLATRPDIDRQRRAGFLVILVFSALFIGWGALAPLAGGAVAPGEISPDGGVKTVQHLEGGIIARIHVREGDSVRRGSPLITLESVSARAEVETFTDRRNARLIESARHEAVLLGHTDIVLPNDLPISDRSTRAAIAAEKRLFEASNARVSAQKRVLSQRVLQLEEQVRGLEAQVTSVTDQLELIDEELTDKSRLLESGLAKKGDLLRLQRMQAELRGTRGGTLAAIAEARQRIGQTELELIAIDAERSERVAERAREVRGELAEIDQALSASRDILHRRIIAAPVDGVVANMRIRTTGGVVRAADPILDIVPSNERLLVNARVSPTDIDVVHAGLKAHVQLLAYSGRAQPRITGTVTHVSADALRDDATGRTFYRARVEVPISELSHSGELLDLMPGMPADVMIVSGERSLMAYILEPFSDILWYALRES